MKDSKKDANKPRPNMKNKDFVAWTKAESCRKEDNIVSTDWHEKLKKLEPFSPVYDNKPVNMVYLLCGEYGRLWQKERDEWYKGVFVPQAEQKDFEDRKKKIRQQARAAKKAAQISANERKERRAKELEAKAKAEAEKLEKLKERVRKLAAPKLPAKAPKKKKEAKAPSATAPATEESKPSENETCPKGWKPVELTIQCECSDHDNGKSKEEEKTQREPETSRTEASSPGCTMCDGYVQQLQNIHEAKCKENESNEESHKGQEKEMGPLCN